ncbi:MAG: transporter substrate-binding domain-containing protein [Kangiella sp.]|jgi:polar amino acid transport system substrate-binding protein|nr:transporter substrate-binding domain-containing protein [Kangiella sp.]
MNRLSTLLFVSTFFLVACGGGDTNPATTETTASNNYDCVIKYGWEPRPPYQFLNNGEMQGIDIEIFKKAAEANQCNVQYVQKGWSELLTALEEGEIDVLGGATATPERQVYADFSVPYRNESFALFIRSTSDYQGETLAGFLSGGNKVGITNDYYYGQDVYNLMNHPQYGPLFVDDNSGEQSFYNVIYSTIDGVLTDPVEGRYIIKRKGLDSQIKQSNITIPSENVSFMFSKKGLVPEKSKALQDAIQALVSANEVNPVVAKYQ